MARLYFIFRSTHETLKAEKSLQAAGVRVKVVMKPSAIEVDCGLAIRTEAADQEEAIANLVTVGLKPMGIFSL